MPTLAQLLRDLPDKQCGHVPKVFRYIVDVDMVLCHNGATEINYANGVPGTGTKLVLDANEPAHDGGLVWRLKYPPKVLYFVPEKPAAHGQLDGLPPETLPIFPKTTNFECLRTGASTTKTSPTK